MAGQRNVVILGAGGYLGSSLCRFFNATPSCRVIAVARRQPAHVAFSNYIKADVFADEWAEKIPTDLPIVLINCAFDFKTIQKGDWNRKYEMFQRNITGLSRHNSTLINISSTSAFPGCRTAYGHEKLFVEDLFAKFNGTSVRPGLIVSWRNPGAAFANLISIVKTTKFIPLLTARGSGYYLCDLEAVVIGIYALAGMRLKNPHILSFTYHGRMGLGTIVGTIETKLGISRIKIPIPWQVAYLLLRVKEAMLGQSKVRADSILDFAHPAPFAEGRNFFARLIEYFRTDLERLSDPKFGDFYHLEPTARRIGTQSSCRAKEKIKSEIGTRLGSLSNA
jgi:nucleoside-diphosphate-sugar epimerase